MVKFNFITKNRGKKGDGRAVIFRPVQLPEDLLKELKLYKFAYEEVLVAKNESGELVFPNITFEELFRHWMENVHCFDPEVQDEVDRISECRKNAPTTYYVDPSEGDIWEMTYVFEKDGEEIPAYPDKKLLFYGEVDGKKVSMVELDREGWTLMNEAGIEIDIIEARKVSDKLLKHTKKEKK